MNSTTAETSADNPRERSPEEIQQESDRTREELGRTMEALGSRLSPRRRLNDAAESMRETGGRLMRTGLNAVTPDITTMIRLDHTHVLALFRRFKPYTSLGKKRALVTNACRALEIHAQLEEEIFYPAMREAAGPSAQLDKSIKEHDTMRKLIADVRALEPGDAKRDETFRALIRDVLHHVADEETTLLPLAEEVMGDQLGRLGLQMTRRRIELLKPHAQEVAVTSMRSFPLLFGAAAAGALLLGWLALRPRKRIDHWSSHE
jgi:hemerythrin superfamily protein